MMRHFPDLGNAFVWLKQISLVAQPIRSTTEIWIVMCHQYVISSLVSYISIHGQTSDGIAECWLFSRAGCGMGNCLEH